MFNFNTNKGIDSILGVQTQIKGEIKSKGTLRLDGIYEGTLEADWIILGESAHFVGEMSARRVLVGGKIEGHIKAKECVEIKSKGQIIGDITTGKLIVSEGGILEGLSTMHSEDSTIIEFPQKKES